MNVSRHPKRKIGEKGRGKPKTSIHQQRAGSIPTTQSSPRDKQRHVESFSSFNRCTYAKRENGVLPFHPRLSSRNNATKQEQRGRADTAANEVSIQKSISTNHRPPKAPTTKKLRARIAARNSNTNREEAATWRPSERATTRPSNVKATKRSDTRHHVTIIKHRRQRHRANPNHPPPDHHRRAGSQQPQDGSRTLVPPPERGGSTTTRRLRDVSQSTRGGGFPSCLHKKKKTNVPTPVECHSHKIVKGFSLQANATVSCQKLAALLRTPKSQAENNRKYRKRGRKVTCNIKACLASEPIEIKKRKRHQNREKAQKQQHKHAKIL